MEEDMIVPGPQCHLVHLQNDAWFPTKGPAPGGEGGSIAEQRDEARCGDFLTASLERQH